jgi:hypothetical protein
VVDPSKLLKFLDPKTVWRAIVTNIVASILFVLLALLGSALLTLVGNVTFWKAEC